MNSRTRLKAITCVLVLFVLGCSSPLDLPTPERIGEKERTRIISGEQAAQVVNKLHGRSVATQANVIAEYGSQNKDLLYVSHYADQHSAEEAFNLMIEKMASAKKDPFFHLMPLSKYKKKVYFTLGMGAAHYIYLSGRYLLWFQTYQSFGDALPQQLLEIFPV